MLRLTLLSWLRDWLLLMLKLRLVSESNHLILSSKLRGKSWVMLLSDIEKKLLTLRITLIDSSKSNSFFFIS